jgi:transposase-like protein
MSCSQEVHCPYYDSPNIIKSGKNPAGTQRYLCQNKNGETQTFMLDYRYKACESGMTEKIIEMAINGNGIQGTARILNINKNTVINTLKKEKRPYSSNP